MTLGDFALETTIYAKFTTVTTTGAPTVLAGSPVVSVYENDDNTQITAGVTLNVDEDAVVGLNQLVIVATAANGYEAGKFYDAVITTGTVGGTSVVGYVVASFTIQAVSALRPTVAARTLGVSAGGQAGIDWANIGSPTTAQNLSGTNIDVDQIIASVSGAVGSIANGGIVAATFAANALDAVWSTAARTLTALTGGTVAADIRTALGMSAADLDAQLDTLAALLAIIDDFVDDLEGRLTSALATALTAYSVGFGRAIIAAGATTTSIPLTSVNGGAPSATNDQYNGRVLIFTSGTLALQAVAITDYVGATTTLTVTAATGAPADTTTALIV